MGGRRKVAADPQDFMRILADMAALHTRLLEHDLTASICEMGVEDEDEDPLDLVGIFSGEELVLWEPRGDDVVVALRELMDRWDMGEQASEAGYQIAVVADHQGRAERVEIERDGVAIGSEPVVGKTNAAIRRLMRRHGIGVLRTATSVIGEA